jgi:hypothetical protein
VLSGILTRGAVIGVVALACATFLIAALGLLVAAVFFAFENILSPVFAALAAAGSMVILCILVIVIGRLILSRLRKRARRKMRTRVAAAVSELFGSELGVIADRHPARAMGIALAAGFAIGFSPSVRRALFSFLRR